MILETGQYCEKCAHRGICKWEDKRKEFENEIDIPEHNGDYDGVFQIRFYCKKYKDDTEIKGLKPWAFY